MGYCAGVDYNLSYIHSRVDSNTFTMGGHWQPYARVDLNPIYARVNFIHQLGTLDLASSHEKTC